MICIKKLEAFLKSYQEECKNKASLLAKDDRVDEANFEKIKGTICPIVLAAASNGKTVEGTLALLGRITTGWEVSLENAIKKNDYQKEMVERVKLETRDYLVKKLGDFDE